MIALNQDHNTLLEFHQILQDKLFLEKIQSCNTKDELNYYIKPKDKFEALHDRFIKYGTKQATSFLIIDIDNISKPLNEFTKEVLYKLEDIKPNWISRTDKGFHIGFILEKPIWLNNDEMVKKAEQIKRDLTILFDGDIAGSHRLLGYWRNPIKHESMISTQLHYIDELQKIAAQQYLESFSLFDDLVTNQQKAINRTIDKKTIAKSNWIQIDKKGFTPGNRNNFLFNKVIGMLYNGLISNDEIITTLEQINEEQLEQKELEKIAKSIQKYNIKPNSKLIQEKQKKGIYSKDLWDNQIHNYRKNNKIQFERQKIGQKISTAKIIEKTINKLVEGYTKTYKNKQSFTNKNLEENTNMNKRTIQRYRNQRELEKTIKAKALKLYMVEISTPQGVKADVTPIKEIVNIALADLEYQYPINNKLFKFQLNEHNRLIFYDLNGSWEDLAA